MTAPRSEGRRWQSVPTLRHPAEWRSGSSWIAWRFFGSAQIGIDPIGGTGYRGRFGIYSVCNRTLPGVSRWNGPEAPAGGLTEAQPATTRPPHQFPPRSAVSHPRATTSRTMERHPWRTCCTGAALADTHHLRPVARQSLLASCCPPTNRPERDGALQCAQPVRSDLCACAVNSGQRSAAGGSENTHGRYAEPPQPRPGRSAGSALGGKRMTGTGRGPDGSVRSTFVARSGSAGPVTFAALRKMQAFPSLLSRRMSRRAWRPAKPLPARAAPVASSQAWRPRHRRRNRGGRLK